MRLADLNDPHYIAFESYRKNGDGVNTPLWVVEENDNLYAWTAGDSWKVKRVRNNSKVRVAVSDSAGKPKGEWLDAVATVNDSPAEEQKIRRFLIKKYSWQYWMIRAFNFFRRSGPAVVIEIRDV